jgi:hypothetical protein
MIKLNMTPEELHEGFVNFIQNKSVKIETDTYLDSVIKNGIPSGKLSVVIGSRGKSQVNSYMKLYLEYIKANERDIKINDILGDEAENR